MGEPALVDGAAPAGTAPSAATPTDERQRFQSMLRAELEHRLKTSLAVIAGWATTLDERWEQLPEERRRQGVGIIRRASEEMADQARRLLEQARAELLSLDQEPVRLDLCAVLDVTTEAFDGVSDRHRVEHVTSGASVEVEVDPAALQQVLGHLVENAVKYSPPGSQVTVAARAGEGCALLEVRDEGVGVPDDVELFAPFARGRHAEDLPGAGLGLYIVRNLVDAMGGEVTARRNSDGPGSTFVIRLPADP